MKRFFGNKWVRGIGITVIGGIIAGICLYLILQTKIPASIWGGIKCASAWFITAKLKVWIVLIIVVLVFWITSIYWESRLNRRKFPQTPPGYVKPKWMTEYTSDIFEEIRWRWVWAYDHSTDEIVPANFKRHCPECDCGLTWNLFGSNWKCPDCKKQYNTKENDIHDNRVALIQKRRKEIEEKQDT